MRSVVPGVAEDARSEGVDERSRASELWRGADGDQGMAVPSGDGSLRRGRCGCGRGRRGLKSFGRLREPDFVLGGRWQQRRGGLALAGRSQGQPART